MGEEKRMTDKEQIIQLYHEMYAAMVNKDRAGLERVHDDSFVLVHMTGMLACLDAGIANVDESAFHRVSRNGTM